jgi:hypothetical protein
MTTIITTAKNLGIKARKNGKSCVAAWDSKCVELAGTSTKHSKVFKAWVEGWNQENIKQAWN